MRAESMGNGACYQNATAPEARETGLLARHGRESHGLYRLKAAVKELGTRGLRVVDRRTTVGRELAAWRGALETDLGGGEALSTQQRALVELCVRSKLLLDSVDAFLLRQKSLVNARRKSLLPVVRERLQLAADLRECLKLLGLARQQKAVPSLQDFLEGKADG